MRILVTSTPGTGHVHPLVPIALELQRRGHDVRWAAPADATVRVRAYGLEAVDCGMAWAERQQQFFSSTDLSDVPFEELRPVFFAGLFARISAPAMRRSLQPIIDDFRPDVAMHELCELALPPMAAARGIPCATVAFSGAPYPAMIEPARPWVDELWVAEGVRPSADFGWFDHLYLHPWPESLGGRPPRRQVHATWHMGFDGAVGDPPEWLEGLGGRRPLVYASFGTEMGRLAPWSAVLEALGSMDVDVVATIGGSADPAAFTTAPANVRVETYVPQGFVLDRASCMISHGGAGAVAAAIERGVPQVVIPLGADQLDNASACAAAGVASVITPGDRDATSIASAVSRVLSADDVAARCRAVRDEVQAMPGPAAAADLVERLV